ncbi:hypothetical protein R83H12_00023 [Fibrobacteria bacterium R8-3-H12]
MKTSIKTIACVFAISVALSSCTDSDDKQNNPNDKLPVMDSRVVSYTKFLCVNFDCSEEECECLDPDRESNFITKDNLEILWPLFDNVQKKSECNYFAIYFSTSSTNSVYWILSQDMILYKITPYNSVSCPVSPDIMYHIMLVCDDTEEGNLKDKIDFSSIRSYTYENWDCKNGHNAFF